MFKSQIIKMYLEYGNEHVHISKKHEEKYDEVIKYEAAMLEKFGDDEEFKNYLKDLIQR